MTSSELIGVLGFIVMLLGIFLGIHLGVVLSLVGFAGFVTLLGFSKSISVLVTTPYHLVTNYSFIVLPMFVLMGEFTVQGGLGRLLFKAFYLWMGRIHGGVAVGTTAASAIYGAISGSSMAATAVFSKIAVPEMMRLNYDKKFACGVVAAAGPIDAMIPPSGLMVLYCILTGVSLGKVMIGGIIPGVLTALAYMGMIYIRARLNPNLGPPSRESFSLREKTAAIGWLTPVLIVVIVMIGGIYVGIFSPVEAGAVGAFSVFAVVLARRSIDLRALIDVLTNTATTSGMIFFVLIGGIIFGKFVALSGLSEWLLRFVKGIEAPPLVILSVILFIYLILGCIMDVPAMLVTTLPIFFPILDGLGLDGVWFGILIIQICEIGVITPPIGMNVFVMKAVLGDLISLEDLFRGIFPLFILFLLILAVLVAFPILSLWLPSKMF